MIITTSSPSKREQQVQEATISGATTTSAPSMSSFQHLYERKPAAETACDILKQFQETYFGGRSDEDDVDEDDYYNENEEDNDDNVDSDEDDDGEDINDEFDEEDIDVNSNNNSSTISFWELVLSVYIPTCLQLMLETSNILRTIFISCILPVLVTYLTTIPVWLKQQQQHQHGSQTESQAQTATPIRQQQPYHHSYYNDIGNSYSWKDCLLIFLGSPEKGGAGGGSISSSSCSSPLSPTFSCSVVSSASLSASASSSISVSSSTSWPPSALILLAVLTVVTLIVHPDGYTWILLRKLRNAAMCLVDLSATCWAIAIHDYGTIVSSILALSTFAALFFFAYVLRRTLKKNSSGSSSKHAKSVASNKKKKRKGGGGGGSSNHHNNHRNNHQNARAAVSYRPLSTIAGSNDSRLSTKIEEYQQASESNHHSCESSKTTTTGTLPALMEDKPLRPPRLRPESSDETNKCRSVFPDMVGSNNSIHRPILRSRTTSTSTVESSPSVLSTLADDQSIDSMVTSSVTSPSPSSPPSAPSLSLLVEEKPFVIKTSSSSVISNSSNSSSSKNYSKNGNNKNNYQFSKQQDRKQYHQNQHHAAAPTPTRIATTTTRKHSQQPQVAAATSGRRNNSYPNNSISSNGYNNSKKCERASTNKSRPVHIYPQMQQSTSTPSPSNRWTVVENDNSNSSSNSNSKSQRYSRPASSRNTSQQRQQNVSCKQQQQQKPLSPSVPAPHVTVKHRPTNTPADVTRISTTQQFTETSTPPKVAMEVSPTALTVSSFLEVQPLRQQQPTQVDRLLTPSMYSAKCLPGLDLTLPLQNLKAVANDVGAADCGANNNSSLQSPPRFASTASLKTPFGSLSSNAPYNASYSATSTPNTIISNENSSLFSSSFGLDSQYDSQLWKATNSLSTQSETLPTRRFVPPPPGLNVEPTPSNQFLLPQSQLPFFRESAHSLPQTQQQHQYAGPPTPSSSFDFMMEGTAAALFSNTFEATTTTSTAGLNKDDNYHGLSLPSGMASPLFRSRGDEKVQFLESTSAAAADVSLPNLSFGSCDRLICGVRENPFETLPLSSISRATFTSPLPAPTSTSSYEDDLMIEAKLQELGGQMVGSILDF